MNGTHEHKSRIGWLTITLVALALVVFGMPNRLLTQWTYAVERGKLQASAEELAEFTGDMARLQEISRAFRLVAKVAGPGVVHIQVRDKPDEENDPTLRELRKELEERLGDEFNEQRWRQFLRQYRSEAASGSGIIFDSNGYILTNNHVVADRDDIRVQLSDDREYDAVLIGADPMTDLALIKINATDLRPLKFGDSERVQVGDWVVAVGAPFNLPQTVTHGIVSATGRADVLASQGILYPQFIQTDAAINPGNSGGPLVNLRGEVVGVNTAIATNGDGYNAGIAFTIPSNLAMKIAGQLRERGEVVRGWLGITMQELTREDRSVLGVEGRRGVMVRAVNSDTPAEQAGLVVEDVILSVNGHRVANMAQLRGVIAEVFPGETATLDLRRGKEQLSVAVKLGRRPDPAAMRRGLASNTPDGRELESLGLYGRTMLSEVAAELGYEEPTRGVLITGVRVTEGEEAGLEPGEIIEACNGKTVKTTAELITAVSDAPRGKTISLTIRDSNSKRRSVAIERQ